MGSTSNGWLLLLLLHIAFWGAGHTLYSWIFKESCWGARRRDVFAAACHLITIAGCGENTWLSDEESIHAYTVYALYANASHGYGSKNVYSKLWQQKRMGDLQVACLYRSFPANQPLIWGLFCPKWSVTIKHVAGHRCVGMQAAARHPNRVAVQRTCPRQNLCGWWVLDRGIFLVLIQFCTNDSEMKVILNLYHYEWAGVDIHGFQWTGSIHAGFQEGSMRITCLSFCCTPAALFIPWQLSLPHITALFTTHDRSLYHTCIHIPLYHSGSIFYYYPSTPALVQPVTLSLPLVHQQPTLPFRQTRLLITRYRQPSLPL